MNFTKHNIIQTKHKGIKIMRNHRFLAKTASAAILALAAIGIVNTNNNTNSTCRS
jgi:hypothetical protein